ncbi:ATP-binding cassette domain-containing protein [Paenarthrobacter sp. NPDC018779]|uniref:ABC transporter ATP-binding protein/permease n=1 Tax=Paenarthrobacter sp. NPDC018779 TaxID=3364375 RepID=UPI0037C7F387
MSLSVHESNSGIPLLVLSDVSKIYANGEVSALQSCDLVVFEGDFVAIIGPSGSGKSTLLNILGLLDTPTTGRYFLSGQDTSTLSERARDHLRSAFLGFVFQQSNVLGEESVSRNAALPLRIQGIPTRQRPMIVAKWLAHFGLLHRTESRGKDISGGERQRLALARALTTNPSVLLADEPTGNLDSANTARMIENLRELNRAGTTVVVITHDAVVAAAATRVVRISDGVLHDGLVTNVPVTRKTPKNESPRPSAQAVQRIVDYLADAMTALATQFGRTLLLMLAFAVGIAGLVAANGVSQSAAGHVSQRISKAALDEVTLSRAAPSDGAQQEGVLEWATRAKPKVLNLDGVQNVGFRYDAPAQGLTVSRFNVGNPNSVPLHGTPVIQADRGLLEIYELETSPRNAPASFDPRANLHVALLGKRVAESLGVAYKTAGNSIWISGQQVAVAGVIDNPGREPDLDSAIVVSPGVVSPTYAYSSLVVRTLPGYPTSVAESIALAVDPGNPGAITVGTVADLRNLSRGVTSDLGNLIGGIGLIVLLLAAVSGSTTMYIAVRSRTPKIALRRALGATRRSIACSFLLEGILIGLLGGLLGGGLGAATTVIASALQGWTPFISYIWIPGGLGLGVVTGLVSAIHPALIAARQSPAQAIRG